MKYENEQIQLGCNDILAFYSDGISEAENQRGEEFTREQLGRLIAANSTLTAEGLLAIVFTTIEEFTEHQTPSDDQTLLILKVG